MEVLGWGLLAEDEGAVCGGKSMYEIARYPLLRVNGWVR
jgi:hypothetical protein